MDDLTLRQAKFTELDVQDLYALLKLRQDVFVVEQKCAFAEIDGRDAEPGVIHLWISDAQGPLSYLRVFDGEYGGEGEGDVGGGAEGATRADGAVRIGRVVTAAHARGRGLSGQLMEAALDLVGERPPCSTRRWTRRRSTPGSVSPSQGRNTWRTTFRTS